MVNNSCDWVHSTLKSFGSCQLHWKKFVIFWNTINCSYNNWDTVNRCWDFGRKYKFLNKKNHFEGISPSPDTITDGTAFTPSMIKAMRPYWIFHTQNIELVHSEELFYKFAFVLFFFNLNISGIVWVFTRNYR